MLLTWVLLKGARLKNCPGMLPLFNASSQSACKLPPKKAIIGEVKTSAVISSHAYWAHGPILVSESIARQKGPSSSDCIMLKQSLLENRLLKSKCRNHWWKSAPGFRLSNEPYKIRIAIIWSKSACSSKLAKKVVSPLKLT